MPCWGFGDGGGDTSEVIDTSGRIATAGAYRTYPRLKGGERTDWLIIGGGRTGLAAARRLARLRPRERIVLIEAKRIAQGASGRNSGFLVGYDLPEHPGDGISRRKRMPRRNCRSTSQPCRR
jgi:cation diffusion facilitator CzcD-associated flavoprotein CzcO